MKHQKILVSFLIGSAIAVTNLPAALAQSAQSTESAQATESAQSTESAQPPRSDASTESDVSTDSDMPAPLNLSPEVIEQSPVLQRWLEKVPNIQSDIRNDPSFKTRAYAGYSYFPSSGGTSGFAVGIEDWFIGDTPLTLSADYQQNFERDRTSSRQAYGADLHYYVLPLGGYVNVAPTLGYRHAESGDDYSVSGANVGLRLRLVPSRTGAADLTIDQSWIVGDSEGLSITQINAGYAVTSNLRLSTDLEWQRTADEGDSRVGINLEWAL